MTAIAAAAATAVTRAAAGASVARATTAGAGAGPPPSSLATNARCCYAARVLGRRVGGRRPGLSLAGHLRGSFEPGRGQHMPSDGVRAS